MEQSSTVKAKRDVYSIVTERIIEKLEQGVAPWKQPWHNAGQPQNLITGKAYRGINVMLLASLGYEKNYFLTTKQLEELGGSIKPDEKPNIVVYWNWVDPKESEQEIKGKKKKPFLRYYRVFNIAQCDDIPEEIIPEVSRQLNPIPSCLKVVEGMPNQPSILHDGHRAYYNPESDVVTMPFVGSFQSDEAYYATLFHELVHSTGHMTRLNRKGLNEMSEFGSEPYSFEELVAEIGACYLESHTGIEHSQLDQNVAYLKGWLKKFKSDKKFIVQASALAQKATDYILNIHYDDVNVTTE